MILGYKSRESDLTKKTGSVNKMRSRDLCKLHIAGRFQIQSEQTEDCIPFNMKRIKYHNREYSLLEENLSNALIGIQAFV